MECRNLSSHVIEYIMVQQVQQPAVQAEKSLHNPEGDEAVVVLCPCCNLLHVTMSAHVFLFPLPNF